MKHLAQTLVRELGLRPAGQEDELIEYVSDRNINDQRYVFSRNETRFYKWFYVVSKVLYIVEVDLIFMLGGENQ